MQRQINNIVFKKINLITKLIDNLDNLKNNLDKIGNKDTDKIYNKDISNNLTLLLLDNTIKIKPHVNFFQINLNNPKSAKMILIKLIKLKNCCSNKMMC